MIAQRCKSVVAPLDDIGNIRDIELVIQNGKIYERDDFAYKEEN